MELEFLPLKEEHIDRIIEIENLSFHQPWSRGMFERELSLPISNFFVALSAGLLVGYGGFWRVEDEAHLINLAVHPKYRSKGVGRSFLEFLTTAMSAQGLKKILLEVRKTNHSAIQLYGSCGFKTVGIREKYYNNSEDAVLMDKQIS